MLHLLQVHIAAPVVFLFFAGFSLMVIYSSALAFMVDSNLGRSSAAIACNSFFRGVSSTCPRCCLDNVCDPDLLPLLLVPQLTAFVLSECALPIRDRIGDGGLYTLFSGILAISGGVFIVLAFKGKDWRTNPDHRFFGKDKKTSAVVEAEKGERVDEAQRAVDAEEKREAKVPPPSQP